MAENKINLLTDITATGSVREYVVTSDDVFIPSDISETPPEWLTSIIDDATDKLITGINDNIEDITLVARNVKGANTSLGRFTKSTSDISQIYFDNDEISVTDFAYNASNVEVKGDSVFLTNGDVNLVSANNNILSTATASGVYYKGNKSAIRFSSDGYMAFVLGNNIISKYYLTLPNTLSGSIFMESKDFSEFAPNSIDFEVSDTGLNLYILTGSTIKQYIMTSPYALSTALIESPPISTGLPQKTFADISVAAGVYSALTPYNGEFLGDLYSGFFDNTGSYFYCPYTGGTAGAQIVKYKSTSPFEVAGLTLHSRSSAPATVTSTASYYSPSSNGEYLYVVGWYSKVILQYAVEIPFDYTSSLTLIGSYTTTAVVETFIVSPDGTRLLFNSYGTGRFNQLTLSIPYDITSCGTLQTFTDPGYSYYTSRQYAPYYNSDGTKVFFIDGGNMYLECLELSTPYNILTATRVEPRVLISGTSFAPKALISVSESGDTFTVLKNDSLVKYRKINGRYIPEYDIRNRTNGEVDGLISSDGYKYWTLTYASGTNFLAERDLSVKNDISTATATGVVLNMYADSSTMNAAFFTFSSSGYELYFGNGTTNKIYEYKLTTPYDIATATENFTLTPAVGMVIKNTDTLGVPVSLTIMDNKVSLVYTGGIAFMDMSTYPVFSTTKTINYAAKLSTYGAAFNSDGSRFYTCPSVPYNKPTKFYEFELSEPYVIPSTLTTAQGRLLTSTGVSGNAIMRLHANGTKMLLVNYYYTRSINVIGGTLNAHVTLDTSKKSITSPSSFCYDDTGSHLYVSSGSQIHQYYCDEKFNVTSAQYHTYKELAPRYKSIDSIAIYNSKMYVLAKTVTSINLLAENIANIDLLAAELKVSPYVLRNLYANISSLVSLSSKVPELLVANTNISNITTISNKALLASNYANADIGVQVETGKYSAKHWATQNAPAITDSRVLPNIYSNNALANTSNVFAHVEFGGIALGSNATILISFDGYSDGQSVYNSHCLIKMSTVPTQLWRESLDTLGSNVGINGAGKLVVVLNLSNKAKINLSCMVKSYLADSVDTSGITVLSVGLLSTNIV